VTRGDIAEERESDFASLSVINEMDRGEETQSAFKGTIPENQMYIMSVYQDGLLPSKELPRLNNP